MTKSTQACCGWASLSTLIVTVLLGGSPPSRAQQEPASRVRESTTVTVIEVPVIVLRNGTPVRDLAAEDFQLMQDGVERPIEGFERVDLSVVQTGQASPDQQPVSLAGRRYFLLAFDLSHTLPANARRAAVAARNLVETGLHPTDLVGVSVYGAVAGARLLHPFTSDKSKLEAALLAVEAVISRDQEVIERARAVLESRQDGEVENLVRFLEEIRVFATQQGLGLESPVGPAGQWLAGFDASGRGAVMAETLADMEAFHQENTLYRTRDQSLDLLETLSELASALEEVRGQRNFVLFSEGIELSILGDYSYIQGTARFSNTHGSNRLGEVLTSFRQSGWVVQAVNVTQTTDFMRGMSFLAEETGGREYRNFGRLDQAMAEMLEQTSVSYVVSFQPEDLVLDGSYHQIDVRLRRPGGAKIRHRDGFFAPLPSDREEDFLVAQADRVASEAEGGPLDVAAIAAPFKNSVDTWRVISVVELGGATLLTDHQSDLLQIEIDSYLVGEAIGAIPLSKRRLNFDLERQAELIAGGGVKVIEEFLLGPGDHQLRVAITDADSGRRTLVTVPVAVPDHPSNGPQLLEPFFPELSPSWLVVREPSPEDGFAGGSPFQFGDRQFVPRAAVHLAPTATVPVIVMARQLTNISEELLVSLWTENGTESMAGTIRWVGEPERTENGLIKVMAELDTTGLTPGRYEVRVSDPGGTDGLAAVSSRWVEIRSERRSP